MKENFTIDDLLVKYLLGEASRQEQQQVQDWLEADAENQRYYEHFRIIWEESRTLAAQSTVDENAAWERFKTLVAEEEERPKTIPLRPAFGWSKVAAVLTLIVVSGALVYFLRGNHNEMIAVKSTDRVVTDTLSDGSVVVLNKNASLSYPEDFTGNTREVELNGEAFFTITPNKAKPFIIKANGVSIRVVGTSFNVKTAVDKTEVIVETGVVAVTKKDNTINVKPHEKAVVLKNQKPEKESNTDELYNYYRTKEFVCNDTPLWRLADILQEAYGVPISIENENIRNKQINTTFHDESLDHILTVVGETLGVTVEKTQGGIVLK
ncbi:FecR domain-containing protein [Taibaiella soli]|uniref:Iron dicitrate transport regulator FecR n=1 Tax=Taibaiella soli TaxID=1649169 RepID=A0A2W2B1A4_9BACT|nr:FecR domain-containing protein [Taibaiella soli]PZF74024.1 iron dicitrate transport regulator FecR [Taibaiella soli]